MGYYQGGSSTGSSGNLVVDDLHWKKTGDGGTVGGDAANFEVCAR